MIKLSISNEDIIQGFRTWRKGIAFLSNEIIQDLQRVEDIQIDKLQDLRIVLNGTVYYVISKPEIERLNDSGDYIISFIYEIKKHSKYSDVLYTLRT